MLISPSFFLKELYRLVYHDGSVMWRIFLGDSSQRLKNAA
jgi:hypothetical protein